MRITATHFVLAVPDADATGRWWVDVMDFAPVVSPDGWKFVRRDNSMIMLGTCPDAMPPADLGDHSYFAYFVVEDLDDYHQEIAARGANVLKPPTDKDWGMREMAVRSPDGHRMLFGEELD